MHVQVKSAIFKPSDPLPVLSLPHNFNAACDSNGIHKGAAIWLFQHLMKDPVKAALAHGVSATNEDDPQQEGNFTTYCQVVKYLLANYPTDDFMAETEVDMANFKQPEGMFSVPYSQVLLEKALHCGHLYDELRLKEVFVEGLHDSIRFLIRPYWSAHKDVNLENLAPYETSQPRLQEVYKSTSTRSNNNNSTRRRRKQLLSYPRKVQVTPILSNEQRRGSATSLSSSGEACKRSKRRKSRKSSRLRQERNSLDIALVITQTSQGE